MAETAFDDTDPSAYSQYVLYVRTNDPNCLSVTNFLETVPLSEKVFVQDVMKMAARPPWLRGVPTLHQTQQGTTTTGMRDIIAYATSWRNTELTSITSSIYSSSASSSCLGGGSLFDSGMFALEGDPTSTPSQAPAPGGQMGERAKRKAEMSAETNNAVEQMQNARALMDRKMHATMQQGSVPPPRNMMTGEQEVKPRQQRQTW